MFFWIPQNVPFFRWQTMKVPYVNSIIYVCSKYCSSKRCYFSKGCTRKGSNLKEFARSDTSIDRQYSYHSSSLFSFLTPASQVEVGCPWARGLQPQYTPRRKNTHRPTNSQPSHEPPRAKPKGPPGRKPGARGLGAAEPQAPRAQTWGTHPHGSPKGSTDTCYAASCLDTRMMELTGVRI